MCGNQVAFHFKPPGQRNILSGRSNGTEQLRGDIISLYSPTGATSFHTAARRLKERDGKHNVLIVVSG